MKKDIQKAANSVAADIAIGRVHKKIYTTSGAVEEETVKFLDALTNIGFSSAVDKRDSFPLSVVIEITWPDGIIKKIQGVTAVMFANDDCQVVKSC